MKIINSLNWIFDFGKHKYQTIKETIESNPSAGTVKLGSITAFVAFNGSLISYLEWAEEEGIVNVSQKIWDEIKTYDNLYIKIERYKKDSKSITLEEFNECVRKFNSLNDKYDLELEEKNDQYHNYQYHNYNHPEYYVDYSPEDRYCGACMESPCMCSDPY